MDAILVPAAARAGREDEKLATVAFNKVAVGIPLLANSRREDRVSIFRTTKARNNSFYAWKPFISMYWLGIAKFSSLCLFVFVRVDLIFL